VFVRVICHGRFRVQGSGFRVLGSGFWVQGSDFSFQELNNLGIQGFRN
jgi:hypothetical protein